MTNKQALKADFKLNGHRMRTMGVYQIRNLANGKVFLNAGLNLEGAIARDRWMLGLSNHLNKQLQAEWQTYGADAFAFEILEALTPTDDLRDYPAEAKLLLEAWLAQVEPYGDKGYLPAPR